MTDSAQGIDVSAYQAVLTAAQLEGLSFAFAKATDGPSATDPNFAPNWAAMKTAGIHRGAYHELQSSGPQAQAAHFLAAVKAQGLEPGDMLAVVASDYPGVTGADVGVFCGEVKAAAPRSPVLVYSDLSMLPSLGSCAGYLLWAAWPSATAPADVAPWKTWTFWQWNETTLDRDAYNGTAAELDAWIGSIANPGWTFPAPAGLHVVKQTREGYSMAWDAVTGPSGQKPASYSVYTYSAAGAEVNHQVVTGLAASEYGPSGKGLPEGKYQTRVWADGAPDAPPHATLNVTLAN